MILLVEARLQEYGDILGLVFGQFGEASENVQNVLIPDEWQIIKGGAGLRPEWISVAHTSV